jgi:hypothetical protein
MSRGSKVILRKAVPIVIKRNNENSIERAKEKSLGSLESEKQTSPFERHIMKTIQDEGRCLL